jgi:methyltransferase-like protein 6
LLDLGCGVGNACYPLVGLFGMPPLRVQCCDFSPKAVNFVKEHELYNEEKIDAKTCDLVKEEIPFAPQTANFGILIFVLSAISPENFTLVAKKIYD